MKKLIITFILILTALSSVNAQYPDGKEILLKIDQNLSSENRIFHFIHDHSRPQELTDSENENMDCR